MALLTLQWYRKQLNSTTGMAHTAFWNIEPQNTNRPWTVCFKKYIGINENSVMGVSVFAVLSWIMILYV